ncbi:MAG: sugar kinase [Lachnospiraceae bacterium]|nr:sugar kinase [Lachnospiraceae bacterium]
MNGYFLGIDAGTGSIRAAVFDSEGQLLGNSEAAYSTYYPKNGWAEQDTDEWLRALETAVPACLRDAGVSPSDIRSIVCDATTCTLVFLDEQDEPVRRPLLWMDVRAVEEARELDELRYGPYGVAQEPDGLRYGPGGEAQGNGPAASDGRAQSLFPAMDVYLPNFRADTMIPKCMWMKRHERTLWDRTRTIFEFEDWLNFMLTGEKTLSTSVAAFRWNYDAGLGGLPVGLYVKAGIGDVKEKIPARELSIGEPVGTVTKEAAARFGLSEGTPVFEGSCDCNAAMLGTGCVSEGSIVLVSGTSTAILGLSDVPFHTAGVNGTYPDCIFPGTGLAESGQTASGAILTWFRNTLLPTAWAEEAERRGMNVYDLITEKAAGAPIGCGGVLMLDYFQGNRAPYADSSARGSFVGLSIGTDAACIARAIYEGVAFGAAHCVRVMQESGMRIERVLACGGITSSPFWLQMHADVLGLPITTAEMSAHCPPLGDALIGAAACGVYTNVPEAAKDMVRAGTTYLPDPEAHKKYRFYMDRYLELWPALESTVHRLVEHENMNIQ